MGVQTFLMTKAGKGTSTSYKAGKIPLSCRHRLLVQRHRGEAGAPRVPSNPRKKRVVSKIQIPELKNNSPDRMCLFNTHPKALSDEKVPGKGVRRRPQGLAAVGDNAHIFSSGSSSKTRKSLQTRDTNTALLASVDKDLLAYTRTILPSKCLQRTLKMFGGGRHKTSYSVCFFFFFIFYFCHSASWDTKVSVKVS